MPIHYPLRSVVDTSVDGGWVLDDHGRTSYVNEGVSKMLGYDPSEVVGRSFVEYQVDPPAVAWAHVERWLAGDPERYECCWRRKDGTHVWMEVSAHPITDAEEKHAGALVMLVDITDRRRAEQELREREQQASELQGRLRLLAAKRLNLQEEERKRVSREIHDELGQLLTAIKIDLRSVAKGFDAVDDERRRLAKEQLNEATALVDVTIRKVQEVATQLRPAVLDHIGLAAAVRQEGARFEQRTGVRCEVQSVGDLSSLPPDVSTAAFRILQELLTNVARHAAATRLTVKIVGDPEVVTIEATDDGRGILISEIDNSTSLGLLGMRERASLLGGEILFTGASGVGTTVTLRIPRAGVAREDM